MVLQKKYDQALLCYEAALRIKPSYWYTSYIFGSILAELKQDGAAMVMLHHSLQQNPENVEGLHNLANCMKRQGHRKSAEVVYQQALLLEPNNAQIMCGLAGCLINNGTPEESLEWAEKALAQDPTNQSARYYKGISLLELGQFDQGFLHYEGRKGIPEWNGRPYTWPDWKGEKVKTLLIHGEQGIGDEILYLGWLPKIANKFDRLVIECTPRVVPIFERSFGATCYPTEKAVLENEKSIDAVVAMGSLPHFAGGLPPKGRYLIANQEKVQLYKSRLRALGPGPYIGLSWHGGVVKTHAHYRTTQAQQWARFKDYGTPISIQYGPYGADAEAVGLPHWQDAIDDLDDLLALMAALDLVVTVNNTNVHMAGALDVPCWTLTPSKPAWRYGLKGSEIPWYGSVTQFRQQGDSWDSCFAEVESALGDFVRQKAAA